MKVLQSELGLVKTWFPAHISAIENLYRTDPDFKSLCADLFLCSKLIRDFEIEIFEKQHGLNDYKDIVFELEKELCMVIQNAETSFGQLYSGKEHFKDPSS
jgi:hypothetical protein